MSAAGFYGLDVYSLLESLESIIGYLKEKVGPSLFFFRHIDRHDQSTSLCLQYMCSHTGRDGG